MTNNNHPDDDSPQVKDLFQDAQDSSPTAPAEEEDSRTATRSNGGEQSGDRPTAEILTAQEVQDEEVLPDLKPELASILQDLEDGSP